MDVLNAWVHDFGKRSNQRSETRYQRIFKNGIPKRGTDIPEFSNIKVPVILAMRREFVNLAVPEAPLTPSILSLDLQAIIMQFP
jgi:hypothetical protein